MTSAPLGGLLACLLAVSTAAATPAPVALSSPRVALVDWSSRAMRAGDLDGDGRADLALINNQRTRIDILYHDGPGRTATPAQRTISRNRWEPVLEDAAFAKASVVTGFTCYDLALGDWNGDGRLDLAYTGSDTALTIRYQEAGGDWSRTWTWEGSHPLQTSSVVRAVDLNADGRSDLAMLVEGALLLFTQGADGRLGQPERYPVPEEGAGALMTLQVRPDGPPALLWRVRSDTRSVRARFPLGNGQYGPVFSFALPTGGGMGSATTGLTAPGTEAFAFVRQPTGRVEWIEFVAGGDPVRTVADFQPQMYASGGSTRSPALYAIADLDGDGRSDLLTADARGSRVQWFAQNRDGALAEGRPFPTLSNLSGLAAGPLFGAGREVVVTWSTRDALLGLSTLNAQGRLSFPDLLPQAEAPVLAAVANVAGATANRAQLLVVGKPGGSYTLSLLDSPDAGTTWQVRTFPLSEMRRDPDGLQVADFSGDGRADLLLYGTREPAMLLVQDAAGGFVPAAQQSALRRSLLGNLEASRLSVADTDADGRAELLLADTGLIRVVELDEQSDWQLLDQANSRASDDRLLGPVFLTLGGQPGLLAYTPEAGEYLWLPRDATGVFRFEAAHAVGELNLRDSRLSPLSSTRPHLLAGGDDRFWLIPLDETSWKTKTLATYETDLKDVQYVGIEAADLNGDKRPEAIVLDLNTPLLEILGEAGANRWQSLLHFTIFERNPHAGGGERQGAEPRGGLTADFNGDGRDDLALLSHDRVLVYYGEVPVGPAAVAAP